MSDFSERYLETALQLEQESIERALFNARVAVSEARIPFDGVHCVHCEEPIPQGRRDLGYRTCIKCQTNLEKRRAY